MNSSVQDRRASPVLRRLINLSPGLARAAFIAFIFGSLLALPQLHAHSRAIHAEVDTASEARRSRLSLGIHRVEPGQNLFAIAAIYRLRVDELAAMNGRSEADILLPGTELRIPLEAGANARAGAPARARSRDTAPSSLDRPSGDGANSFLRRSIYRVKDGDTLYGIAERYAVPIAELKRWNGLPADGAIHSGQTLILQGPASASGQALYDRVFGARAITQGSSTMQKLQESDSHRVGQGETLSSIAHRYGMGANELRRFNQLGNGDLIYTGQILKLPPRGVGSPNLIAAGRKRIHVDISEQRMYVWQGENLVWNWPVSTGMSGYPTRRGDFNIQSKIENAWSNPWQLWMPNWLGIYWAGGSENGIHALPILNGHRLWAGLLGSPASYGCVVLGTENAAKLFDWAELGTTVSIKD